VTCDELRRDAAGLAALAEDDPDRRAAFEHARGCPGCAAALREGERLVAMLEELPPDAAPAEALRRAAAPVLDRLPPVRPGLALPLVTAAAGALVAVAARSTSDAPRDWLAAGALALAAAGVAHLAARSAGAAAGVALALSLVFAVVGGGPGPLDAPEGLRCAATELGAAVLPLAAAAALWRADERARWLLPAAAASGALAGQAALEVACRAPHAWAHLLAFHAAAVLAAALAGAAISFRAVAREP
jgi:hypothetical protein